MQRRFERIVRFFRTLAGGSTRSGKSRFRRTARNSAALTTTTAASATAGVAIGGAAFRGSAFSFRLGLVRTFCGGDRSCYTIADVIRGKVGGISAIQRGLQRRRLITSRLVGRGLASAPLIAVAHPLAHKGFIPRQQGGRRVAGEQFRSCFPTKSLGHEAIGWRMDAIPEERRERDRKTRHHLADNRASNGAEETFGGKEDEEE